MPLPHRKAPPINYRYVATKFDTPGLPGKYDIYHHIAALPSCEGWSPEEIRLHQVTAAGTTGF